MNTQTLSVRQCREVDRRATEEFGISGLVMMENAGRGVADKLGELGTTGPVVICCGKGNNAGDGFVLARHLDLRGTVVDTLLFSNPHRLTGDAKTNFDILKNTDISLECFPDLSPGDLRRLETRLRRANWIVDALLGTGGRGEPRTPLSTAIDLINRAKARKLAIDLPSGLNGDTGVTAHHTVRADHTCTLIAVKPGFSAEETIPFVGQIHVLDIGAPRHLVKAVCAEGLG